jgi:hypothetical protein
MIKQKKCTLFSLTGHRTAVCTFSFSYIFALYLNPLKDIFNAFAASLLDSCFSDHLRNTSSEFSGSGFRGLPNLTPLALAAAIPSACL